MRRDKMLKKLVITKNTLRNLSQNDLDVVVGGTGSCGGGQLGCCRTTAGQESCGGGGATEGGPFHDNP